MLRDGTGPQESGAERLTVPLSELPDGKLTSRVLPNGRTAVILRHGSSVRVFGDTCPHMGAELTQARFCARTDTLHCRWHGYVFDAQDGRFVENPNERIYRVVRVPTPHFRPEKTPQYRLPTIPHRVDGNVLVLGGPRTGTSSATCEQGSA